MEQNDSLLKILTYKLPGAVTRPLFTEITEIRRSGDGSLIRFVRKGLGDRILTMFGSRDGSLNRQ